MSAPTRIYGASIMDRAIQTQDRTGEANALFHHIGKRNEVDPGVCASS